STAPTPGCCASTPACWSAPASSAAPPPSTRPCSRSSRTTWTCCRTWATCCCRTRTTGRRRRCSPAACSSPRRSGSPTSPPAPAGRRRASAPRPGRAFALDGRFARATQIYESYLSRLKPDDPRLTRNVAALLLDLERPVEALRILLPLRDRLRRTPEDPKEVP